MLISERRRCAWHGPEGQCPKPAERVYRRAVAISISSDDDLDVGQPPSTPFCAEHFEAAAQFGRRLR